jgi:hypothetical protein
MLCDYLAQMCVLRAVHPRRGISYRNGARRQRSGRQGGIPKSFSPRAWFLTDAYDLFIIVVTMVTKERHVAS